jgi:hypothetical protein
VLNRPPPLLSANSLGVAWAEVRMRPDMVVVVSLRRDNLARLPRLRNMCRLRHSSRSWLLKLSMNTLCTGLPGWM